MIANCAGAEFGDKNNSRLRSGPDSPLHEYESLTVRCVYLYSWEEIDVVYYFFLLVFLAHGQLNSQGSPPRTRFVDELGSHCIFLISPYANDPEVHNILSCAEGHAPTGTDHVTRGKVILNARVSNLNCLASAGARYVWNHRRIVRSSARDRHSKLE